MQARLPVGYAVLASEAQFDRLLLEATRHAPASRGFPGHVTGLALTFALCAAAHRWNERA